MFLFSDDPIMEMVPMQKQAANSNNWSVFAVAICIAILLKENPAMTFFKEDLTFVHALSKK